MFPDVLGVCVHARTHLHVIICVCVRLCACSHMCVHVHVCAHTCMCVMGIAQN